MKRHPDALISRRNWRDTRAYLTYHDEVLHAAPGSIALYRIALDHALRWSTDIPFARAADVRPVLPRYLADLGDLAHSYQSKLLSITRAFFAWGRERYPDAYPPATFSATLRPVNDHPPTVAERELYTLDDLLALAAVPVRSLTEQRARAAACLLFLSGMRATAFITLPLRAVHLERFELRQWPSLGVRTKNNKAATTYLLQTAAVGPLLDVARAWDTQVRRALEETAPWYALLDRTGDAFAAEQTPGRARIQNLSRQLCLLCERAGIPYRSPHKLRHGFAVYALSLCETMDEFKAVSQNLMHEQMGTTDAIYSALLHEQIAERMAALGQRGEKSSRDARVNALVEELFRLVER